GETPLLEAAATALETGLTLPRPDVAPGGYRFQRRPLAVPVTSTAMDAITELARVSFNNDLREAAGWLIARGLGMALPLPTVEELAGTYQPRAAQTARDKPLPAAQTRFTVPPRRRPEARAPLPPDDSAPNGEELKARREAIGISQRDLAAASGLSRGLVAEVERGRRRHVLTRLRISETLASLERSK
ncbi:MAG TPA: helix-turn-helix domain-containing protein, partial [Chloroflexota bacterium]|nr:helix-turn-helix domain-containing protein [Chloroflexota bacterium]